MKIILNFQAIHVAMPKWAKLFEIKLCLLSSAVPHALLIFFLNSRYKKAP